MIVSQLVYKLRLLRNDQTPDEAPQKWVKMVKLNEWQLEHEQICLFQVIKYDIDDEADEMSDNDSLQDNDLVNGDKIQPVSKLYIFSLTSEVLFWPCFDYWQFFQGRLESDGSDEEKPPPRMQESSEDLFDSLMSGSCKNKYEPKKPIGKF